MALKKRCIGCGYQFDFIAGEMFICPYCGTEQNPGLSVDHTDVLRNALNLRRSKDFGKARDEYKRVLEESPEMAEAHYGLFLCDFEIRSEEDIEKDFKAFEENYAYNGLYSVFKNEHYKNAMNYFSDKEKAKWEDIANKIESCRKANRNMASVVKDGMYRIALICDEENEEDKELADALYEKFERRIDVFYPPVTLENVPESKRETVTIQALKKIPLLFAIYSEDTNREYLDDKFCASFLEKHEGVNLFAITDEEEYLSPDLDCNVDFIPYDADDVTDMENQIRIMSGMSFQQKSDFKEGRPVVNDAMNPSPIIEWD